MYFSTKFKTLFIVQKAILMRVSYKLKGNTYVLK